MRKDIAKVYGIRYDRIPELQEAVRVLVNEYLTDGSIAESTLRGYFADFMKGNIIDNKRRVIYNIFTTKEVIIYDKIGCF